MPLFRFISAAAAIGALALAGCGSSSSSGGGASPVANSGVTGTSAGSSGGGPAALSGEANAARTGDIPDTQVFLVFANRAGGYSMKYPEGWTQKGSGQDLTFADKNNIVHVVISRGAAPTPATVAAQLRTLRASSPALSFTAPKTIQLPAGPAVGTTYTTQSAPNAVTGKRVTLVVDRYQLHRGTTVATVDLGTPKGVDNVDAYKMMIRSFRWK